MKNTRKLFKEIFSKDLKITDKGAINQTQRNGLKNELLNTLIVDLSKELGVKVVRVDKGLAFDIDHDNEGALPITLDIVFKNTTYDIINESQAYIKDKEIKAESKAERNKVKRAKFKNDTATREYLKNKKV
jgi:hypothetical protein